jgi:hypothetical protein
MIPPDCYRLVIALTVSPPLFLLYENLCQHVENLSGLLAYDRWHSTCL